MALPDHDQGQNRSSDNLDDTPAGPGAAAGGPSNNFRNVSACNRCRTRKNRCDQKLPRCSGCEKANLDCVGFDPVSKREIPRSYVYYLETRLHNHEAILSAHGIHFPPPSADFPISQDIKPGINVPFPPLDDEFEQPSNAASAKRPPVASSDQTVGGDDFLSTDDENAPTSLSKAALKRSLAQQTRSIQPPPTSIPPFSKVIIAAVSSSVSQSRNPSDLGSKGESQPSKTASGGGGSASFFALNTRPTVRPAPFPDRDVALEHVRLYFEYANPQIPILHRIEFDELFDRVYKTSPDRRTARELYLLNMVFAIGSGVILGSPGDDTSQPSKDSANDGAPRKRQRLLNQPQPEEYHAAAIIHLERFLGTAPALEGGSAGLEDLQAVLLLAGLALLRPISPGLWYIVGVAVRLAIDLGLHLEENEPYLDEYPYGVKGRPQPAGHRQWMRDLRRRLWWCAYAFDRLVSTCVGRPVCVTDQVITTPFPSMLDDKYIKQSGFMKLPQEEEVPSYKYVAKHYFRLRILQSEILQVLQYRQAEQIRSGMALDQLPVRSDLPSPFLKDFRSFPEWRQDVDRRLRRWQQSAPKKQDTGVQFEPLFLELNYWQAIILLYRQSLRVPEHLVGEISPSTGEDVRSPGTASLESEEDKQLVFKRVAQAGERVLKIYRKLHQLKLVNYTFLATHHIFMSGVCFLYALWNSAAVRQSLSRESVRSAVASASLVLTDLIPKCAPAEACRDSFERMSKVTIGMCMRNGGFGERSILNTKPSNTAAGEYFSSDASIESSNASGRTSEWSTMHETDANALFSDEGVANANRGRVSTGHNDRVSRTSHPQQVHSLDGASSGNLFAEPSSSLPYHNAIPNHQVGSASNQILGSNPGQASHPHPRSQPRAPTRAAFDGLDFLEKFPTIDPSLNYWGMNVYPPAIPVFDDPYFQASAPRNQRRQRLYSSSSSHPSPPSPSQQQSIPRSSVSPSMSHLTPVQNRGPQYQPPLSPATQQNMSQYQQFDWGGLGASHLSLPSSGLTGLEGLSGYDLFGAAEGSSAGDNGGNWEWWDQALASLGTGDTTGGEDWLNGTFSDDGMGMAGTGDGATVAGGSRGTEGMSAGTGEAMKPHDGDRMDEDEKGEDRL